MPKKFDPEIKARAVRMVRRHLAEYGSVTKTSEMVGKQLDISSNTLRRWVVQADIDDGQRDGVPTTTLEELAALKAGVHRTPWSTRASPSSRSAPSSPARAVRSRRGPIAAGTSPVGRSLTAR